MKLLKIAVVIYLLLNSINLYAESVKECRRIGVNQQYK